jgi:hypothetical protein
MNKYPSNSIFRRTNPDLNSILAKCIYVETEYNIGATAGGDDAMDQRICDAYIGALIDLSLMRSPILLNRLKDNGVISLGGNPEEFRAKANRLAGVEKQLHEQYPYADKLTISRYDYLKAIGVPVENEHDALYNR